MNINKYLNKIFIISIFLTTITHSMEQEVESHDSREYQDSNIRKSPREEFTTKEQASHDAEVKKRLLSTHCSQKSLLYICLYKAIKQQLNLPEFFGEVNYEHLDQAAQMLSRLVKSEDVQGYLSEDFLIEQILENTEILDLALDAGATLDYQREYGWTALTWAAWHGYISAIKIILERKNLITSMSFEEYINLPGHFAYSALEFAALAGKGKGLELRSCPNEEIYLEIINLLLENGAENLDKAFQNAILYGNYKIAKFLLDSGAKPTVIDYMTIQGNQHKGYLEMLSLILEHDIDINTSHNEKTPLLWAALAGDRDQLNLLLPFINKIQPRQIDAAFIQAQAARYDKQEELLGDVEARFEKWPWEEKLHRVPTLRLWNVPDEEEYATEKLNALYIGQSKKDYYGVMSVLLDLGADVNIQDRRYELTALLRATMANDIEMVRLLLKHGANKKATDSKGRTPLDIAKEDDFKDIVSLLQNGFLITDFLSDEFI